MWRALDKIPTHLLRRQCTLAVIRGPPTRRVISASVSSSASSFQSHHIDSKKSVVKACRSKSSMADVKVEEITASTGNGYLGKILNAKVYDVAVETELQHAKNLSQVSSLFHWLNYFDSMLRWINLSV